MRGVLPLAVELRTFGSPGGLQLPTFPSVGLHPHTWPKWGCDKKFVIATKPTPMMWTHPKTCNTNFQTPMKNVPKPSLEEVEQTIAIVC